MQRTNIFFIVLAISMFFAGCSNKSQSSEENPEPTTTTTVRCLTVYYSWSGSSRTLATDIHSLTGGDIVEVKPTVVYPSEYNEMLDIAPREIKAIDNSGIYPSISTSVDSFDKYDMLFICTPLWWSRMSTPMQSFLNNHNSKLGGKKIALVVTSQSSGISGVVADAKRLCPNSTFVENSLWITSSQVGSSHSRIVSWLNSIGVKQN